MMNRSYRGNAFFIIALFVLAFCMEGCSTFHNTWRYLKFWEKEGASQQAMENRIGYFASKIRIHSSDPESHYLLGCYYQQKGRHNEAIREFDKAIYVDPSNARAYNGRGVSYDKLRDYARAVESYNMALRINPNLDYVHNNLGYSYLLQGNYNAAIISFKKALALDAKNGRVNNNLGLAYAMNGQYDHALQQFQKSGDKAQAHYNLASVYYEKGRFEEAKEEYRHVLDLNPDFSKARNGFEASEALARITSASSTAKEKNTAVNPGRNAVSEKESDALLEETGIEVSNGNGVNHMARDIGRYLRSKGFNVIRLTNADHFNYREGSILCRKGYCGMAQEIAVWLPNIRHIRETGTLDRDDVKIRILVGREQIRYRSFIMAQRGET